MHEISVFMTDKQIEYVKRESAIKRIAFNEALRQIIDSYQKSEREKEIERAKVIK